MKITLSEWRELAQKQMLAKVALNDLESSMVTIALKHNAEGNKEESLLIFRLLNMATDAGLELSRIDVHPQTEWMGGDSSNPKNFKLREPHCVGLGSARDYLEEEVPDGNPVQG